MFKSIYQSLSICLQGTLFRRHSTKASQHRETEVLWSYSMDGQSTCPPYVLTTEEYKIKNDLITKIHCADNRLQESRTEDRRGRAKWLPDFYEQTYDPPAGPGPNPQVELYYRTLGLSIAREPRTTWQNLQPVGR
jgi:hypothetical protein